MTQSESTVPAPLSAGKRVEDIVTLAKNRTLGRLNLRELGTFLDSLDQIALTKDSLIVREGDPGDTMYFVLEGQARAKRGHLELRRMGPGDQFGELGLIGVPTRSASVEAMTTIRLARVSRARYQSLALNHPTLALHFLQALLAGLGDELTSMTDRVGNLLRERSLPRRTDLRIELAGESRTVGTGTHVGTLLPATIGGALVVAALVDNKLASLETRLVSDATLAPLSIEKEEGREIYQRSAGLLLLEAAHRVIPAARVRLGHSLGWGQIVRIAGTTDDREDIASRLLRAMTLIASEDHVFREEVWTIEEARNHLVESGEADAASLLRLARDQTVALVSCGDVYVRSEGPMVPRTSVLSEFRFHPHPEGLLLDFGPRVSAWYPRSAGANPAALEQAHPRFASDQRRYLETLGIDSVGSFNELCISGQVSQAIRVAEGFHEKRIGQIADAIAARNGRVRVIGIAGPSSSGKTTFIKRLTVQLEVNGLHPVNLSLDDYYVDRDKTAKDENGQYDFEALEAVDRELLQDHLARLLAGEAVKTAHFDFIEGKSLPEGGPELQMHEADVLLVEGIHGLNPGLYGESLKRDQAFHVFVHPASTLPLDRLTMIAPADVRLLRRIVRDRHSRGYSAADNIARWPSVRRGEHLYIYPQFPGADAVFDSAVPYELSVLKVFAERYLLEVPRIHPAFPTAFRLRRLLDRFVTIYPDHVPETSILREFIGGSGFEY